MPDKRDIHQAKSKRNRKTSPHPSSRPAGTATLTQGSGTADTESNTGNANTPTGGGKKNKGRH